MRGFRNILSAITLLAALLMAAPAVADDGDVCFKSSGRDAINACTRAILSGTFSGSGLASLYYNRGWEHDELGEYERAIKDYDKAIELNPKKSNYYYNRALAYSKQNDYDKAIRDLNQSIRLDPKFAAAYNNRGVAYERKGDYKRAIEDYDEAIRIDPKYERAIKNRDEAKKHLGI